MENISAIVLAAGRGKRMKSDMPKVLHEIAGVPMVLLVIDALKKLGIKRIVTVVGFGGDLVKKILPDSVSVVDQDNPLGTGHAVLCAKSIFSGYKGDILIACADMPLIKQDTYRNLIRNHKKEKADCTILTGIIDEPAGYGRIVRDESGNVKKIQEDKDSSEEIKKIKEVNSGTYCFKSEKLFKILPLIKRENRQKEFYLTDTIENLAENSSRIRTFCAGRSSEIYGISTRRDLANIQKEMNRRILDSHMDNGVTIVDPETAYIDIRAKIGRDTVIHPFTVIEGNVKIGRHCEVGPFAHLRDKTILNDYSEIGNFVEVKKSTIGKFTKAKHLTYLGDTTIGQKVNIGAGTITANYDGKKKYPTSIKNGAFIGTHTTLVAPVTVGKGAVTGAGSVVLKNRNVPANTVVVGMPAKVLRKVKH